MKPERLRRTALATQPRAPHRCQGVAASQRLCRFLAQQLAQGGKQFQ